MSLQEVYGGTCVNITQYYTILRMCELQTEALGAEHVVKGA